MFSLDKTPPLSLYIHLPWCVRKCPYCDFNSYALRGALRADAYVDALLRDLDHDAPAAGGRRVDSLFFGGGTPSLFPPAALRRLLGGIRERVNVARAAEITLEANPGTVDERRFGAFRAAGVNRLSIGVQSFSNEQLKSLGRIHDAEAGRRSVRAAHAAGFVNVNVDLMFGLPAQSSTAALRDLEEGLSLSPTHLSHYQLTLEPNTLFHAKPPRLPDDDEIAEMQSLCRQVLLASGFRQYEISAFSLPARKCAHNLNYWTFGDYLAIGAGAHGKLTDADAGTIQRFRKVKGPDSYIERSLNDRCTVESRTLTVEDVALEFMMNALRLTRGFSIKLCEDRTGLPWRLFAGRIARGRSAGLVEVLGDTVRASERGRLFLNDLLELFLPDADAGVNATPPQLHGRRTRKRPQTLS